jgi:hypothetical protein
VSTVTDINEAIQIECEALGDADYTIPQLVDIIDRNYPEAVAEATANSRRQQVTRFVKNFVAPPSSKQPRLPGFENLPLRISLPAEGGYIYRSARVATMDDFYAHLEILDDGIRADTKRRDEYFDAVEQVAQLLRVHGVKRLAEIPEQAS